MGHFPSRHSAEEAFSTRKHIQNTKQSSTDTLCLRNTATSRASPEKAARSATPTPVSRPPRFPLPRVSPRPGTRDTSPTSGKLLKTRPGKFEWSTPQPRHRNPRDRRARNFRRRAEHSIPPTSTAGVAMWLRSALTKVRTVHTGCQVS